MEVFLEVTSQLASGFLISFLLFALTLILALPLGLLISFCTMSKFAPLRLLFRLIVWVLRGTPLMLQIFAIFYLPGLLNLFVWPQMNTGWAWFDSTFSTRFIAALVAFSINYAAYFSEIFRGGIQSISQGQYEAGYVLGMTKTEIFFKIVLLQVIKRIIPPMSNEIITLIKDTSLANTIAVAEIIRVAKNTTGTYAVNILIPLLYGSIFFLLFIGILTVLFNYLEKKMGYYKA